MKKIGFIGAFDKTDLILYIARILVEMKKTVLVIDTTIAQKAKYIVPVINPTKTYFTEYEQIDVAVGFDSIKEMKEYLGLDEYMDLDYDYVLIDVDSPEAYDNFYLQDATLHYFVTSFDLYSLKKGLEVISGLKQKTKFVKVLFSKRMSEEEDEYLDFLSQNYNVEWNEEVLRFPLEHGDQSVIIDNQKTSKIKLKNLSVQYKNNLLVVASQISENENDRELLGILRKLEKGV